MARPNNTAVFYGHITAGSENATFQNFQKGRDVAGVLTHIPSAPSWAGLWYYLSSGLQSNLGWGWLISDSLLTKSFSDMAGRWQGQDKEFDILIPQTMIIYHILP